MNTRNFPDVLSVLNIVVGYALPLTDQCYFPHLASQHTGVYKDRTYPYSEIKPLLEKHIKSRAVYDTGKSIAEKALKDWDATHSAGHRTSMGYPSVTPTPSSAWGSGGAGMQLGAGQHHPSNQIEFLNGVLGVQINAPTRITDTHGDLIIELNPSGYVEIGDSLKRAIQALPPWAPDAQARDFPVQLSDLVRRINDLSAVAGTPQFPGVVKNRGELRLATDEAGFPVIRDTYRVGDLDSPEFLTEVHVLAALIGPSGLNFSPDYVALATAVHTGVYGPCRWVVRVGGAPL